MSRGEARFLHLSQLLVAGSGLVWAFMLYGLAPENEWSVLHHPWQDETQALHVLSAPLLIFAVAAIWKRHAWQRIRSGFAFRRKTGLVLAASFFPMLASAYLLQVTAAENWRTAWLAIHLGSSAIWIFAFLVHLISRVGPSVKSEAPR
jgi:hypothetical protein